MIEPTSNAPQENESWQNEIASRLDRYRTKSNRKLSGDFSMRFNFDGEPAPPRQQVCVPFTPEAEVELGESVEAASDEVIVETQPVVEANAVPEPAELPAAQRPPLRPSVPFKRKVFMEANVIEFPRLFPAEPPPSYALAETLLPSAPRILDAPEIAGPLLETPMLDGMRLGHFEHEPAPDLELPLQVAPIAQRVYAALLDGVIVLIAASVFFAIVYKMLPGLEWTTPLLGASALVPAILWAMYQYLFIVYGARTPGMAMTKTGFSTFQGTAPNRRQRRLRVIGMALSCSSLMLGFVWAFFDEDTLCWHDRISRTYAFHQRP